LRESIQPTNDRSRFGSFSSGTAGDPAAQDEDAVLLGLVAALGIPGLIDVHVHFLPLPVMTKVRAAFDRLHEPRWPLAYRPDDATALALLAGMQVRYHTALAYAHRPGMASWLNAHTLSLAATSPAIVPSFTFYPEPDVDGYVEKALAAGGRCAKVHLQVGNFDAHDARLDGVWAELERRGVAVVLHAGYVYGGGGTAAFCGPRPVRRLVERFPALPVVVAHMGAPHYAEFLSLAGEAPSIYLDTTMAFSSGLLGVYPSSLVERLAPLAAAGKILFGSDFPSIPHAYARGVLALAELGLGDEWLRRVLWTNAQQLLRLDDMAR